MHLAIFEMSVTYFDNDFNLDYVASCVTFMSEDRVPSGTKYNVTYHIWSKNIG